jgi:hypothetical protein
MDFIRKIRFGVLAFTACALPSVVSAAIINQAYSGTFPATISGTLPNQGTALEEAITLPAEGTLTAFTTSYLTGGFEPTLTLFDSAGDYVATSITPGSAPLGPTDLDAYLSASGLAAGQYTIALTDWELGQSLTATNLSDGFTFNLGDGTNFVDQNGITDTGSYSLTVQLSQTPEPSTLLLVAPFFLAAGLLTRKRIVSSK